MYFRKKSLSTVHLMSLLLIMSCGGKQAYKEQPAPEISKTGILSLRGSTPFTTLLFEADSGEKYIVRSNVIDELKRLSSMRVVLSGRGSDEGEMPFKIFIVRSYELLPMPGGAIPIAGFILVKDIDCRFISVDGKLYTVKGEFSDVLREFDGAKIWVTGEEDPPSSNIFRVNGYGIIKPAD